VVFHLANNNETMAAVIQAMPFVREAKVIDNKLVVNLDEPETHNPEIIRALVGAGADIQFVGELRHSLEDVYLQLVKNA
jgi:ABC-2 type transport system ATP-binding protein